MKIPDLIHLWGKTASRKLAPEKYNICLPLDEAAKLQALAEMYPQHDISEIITDLLSAALNDVESSLPYVRGDNVVARDELGDPVYEDIGPTPRYLSLLQKHLTNHQHANETH